MKEADNGPTGRNIFWNNKLEVAFCKINSMVYAEIFLNYSDWKIPYNVHTYVSDKQLGSVISQNYKRIAFFLKKLRKPQSIYTTKEKEILLIVELLKQFRGILFGYKINLYSDHKNLVCSETQSEHRRVIHR